jgi:Tol biopolymer transport system component
LSWTAPGDDDADGRATAYDVRYSTSPITSESFEQATAVPDLPAPARPGERESVSISGLDPITSYYLALVTVDEAGNRSQISNVLSFETTSSWQLTFSPEGGSASHPDWSPDGSTIAFQAFWDGVESVYMIPSEGGDAVKLTDDGGGPAWSPDGTRIAFTSNRAGNFSDIFVMDAIPGAEAVQLTDHEDPAGSPAWSPDGEQISYQVPYFIQLYSPVTMYSVSPEGGESRVLVAPGENWGTFDVAWSPDGTRLVGTCTRTYSWQLWTIPLDGGSWTQLTSTPFLVVNTDPCWSPDGTEIAYVSNMDGGPEIYRLPAAGGTPTRLFFDDADNFSPTWSPDGTRLAFASNRSGTYEIWILLLD